MAYGGPASLEEIPGYLADIRSGRPTPREVLDEITENYRAIGGRSPLLEATQHQVDALAARLGDGLPLLPRDAALGAVDRGGRRRDARGRHRARGRPRPRAALQRACPSPVTSRRSPTASTCTAGAIDVEHVRELPRRTRDSSTRSPRACEEGLSRWAEDERGGVHVVFSAHSLPLRVIASGDPYDEQCRETARLVAERAGLPDERWSWSYQSAGRTPEPWAGPDLGDHLAELAARGVRDVVPFPVGFVSDHVEILFDIDVRARAIADAARHPPRAPARAERRPGSSTRSPSSSASVPLAGRRRGPA